MSAASRRLGSSEEVFRPPTSGGAGAKAKGARDLPTERSGAGVKAKDARNLPTERSGTGVKAKDARNVRASPPVQGARDLSTERPSRQGKTPRRRRDAESAQTAILDAAEQQLGVAGPGGIRLQDVAADVGVSHSTVLHHFGSREGLVTAVIERSFAVIRKDLVTAIQGSSGGQAALLGMLNAVAGALAKGGHGRVLLWLALEGHGVSGAGELRLSEVVDAAHALRTKRRGPELKPPSREDTGHTIVLATMALLGSVVLGPAMLEQAGLPHGDGAEAHFREWLARVLVRHLESGPVE